MPVRSFVVDQMEEAFTIFEHLESFCKDKCICFYDKSEPSKAHVIKTYALTKYLITAGPMRDVESDTETLELSHIQCNTLIHIPGINRSRIEERPIDYYVNDIDGIIDFLGVDAVEKYKFAKESKYTLFLYIVGEEVCLDK